MSVFDLVFRDEIRVNLKTGRTSVQRGIQEIGQDVSINLGNTIFSRDLVKQQRETDLRSNLTKSCEICTNHITCTRYRKKAQGLSISHIDIGETSNIFLSDARIQ